MTSSASSPSMAMTKAFPAMEVLPEEIPAAPAPPLAWMMPPYMFRYAPPPIPAPPGVPSVPSAPMAVREPLPRKEREPLTSIPAVPDEPVETNRFVPSIVIEQLDSPFIFRGTPFLSILRFFIVTWKWML